MKKQRTHHSEGVSLIALVITIIVVIILAAIAFGTSTRTITNANYSDYVNNVGEVYTAFHTRAVTIKGQEAAKGNNVTDAQVYHYLADNSGEFEVRANLPSYTVIKDEGQIGMALPKMRIENADGKMVDVQYAVTSEGEIFTWPPFDYEDSLKISDKYTASAKDAETITVGDMTFTVNLDEDKLLAVGTAGGSSTSGGNGTGGEGGETPSASGVTYVLSEDQGATGLSSGDTVTLTSGDVTEEFYVVSSNSSTTKLLAATKIDVTTLTQSASDASAKIKTSNTENGGYYYWTTAANGSYPYDLTGETVSEEQSTDKVALYAAQAYGRKYGVTGTLLTKSEFDTLSGQTPSNSSYTTTVPWLITNSYTWWLGSAINTNSVWLVNSSGALNYNYPSYTYGVRPVLIVSTSSIS